MTVAKTATFTGEVSNGGTMHIGGKLNTDKFTNSKGATATVGDTAHFHKTATNSGHLFAHKDLISDKKFTNTKHGSMTVAKTATFTGEVSNGGTMHIGGKLNTDKFTNSKGATATVGDTAHFHDVATNDGHLFAHKNLISDKKFTNLKHGTMTVTTTASFTGEVSNAGTMNVLGKLTADKFTNSQGGTTTVGGVAHFYKTATNDGHLFVHKALISDGKFTNLKHGSLTVAASATFKDKVSNTGSIKVTGGKLNFNKGVVNHGVIESKLATVLTAGETITNYNYFKAKTLKVDPVAGNRNLYFNNFTKKAVANFTDIVNEDHLSIDNQGSFLLQGSSTIGNYTGSASSDLVLNLPTAQPKTLLKVANDANFTKGSRIVLVADKPITYLSTPTSIDIITANKVEVSGDVEEVLYSRAYDSGTNNAIKTRKLQPSSILIQITNATATAQHITADLQIASIKSLHIDLRELALVNSLLHNKMASAALENQSILPPIIITANPDKYYDYSKSSSSIEAGKIAHKPAVTVYATTTSKMAMQLGVPNFIVPQLDKITLVSNVVGAVSPTSLTGVMQQDAVVIANKMTKSYAVGTIEITSTATIKGTKGIVINASLTSNIINYGVIDGTDYAVCFNGDGCILNGTITNYNKITSSKYVLYSDPTNNVTMLGARSLVIENSDTGLLQGNVLITGTASLVNHGIVESTTITIAKILNFATITNKPQQALHLVGSVSNTGNILATAKNPQGIGLEVSGTLYNLSHHRDTIIYPADLFAAPIVKFVELNSILIKSGLASFAEVTNSGIIIASGTNTDMIGFYAKGMVYNSGTISVVKGSANFNTELTNTGIILAKGVDSRGISLEATRTIYNYGSITVGKMYKYGSITVTTGDLKLNQGVINNGYIESKLATILTAGEAISNYNYFKAKTLKVDHVAGNNNVFFNNLATKTIAEFTDIINEDHLSMENKGSLLLHGSSTIGNYIGNATSELVLTLPAGNTKPNYPLLTVVNNASFDVGAKIILNATASLGYLTNTSPIINIVKAGTLTINGAIDELLYSRVYDYSSNTINKQIKANSMFISITDVTTAKMSGKDYLQARLELVTILPQLLSRYQNKLTTSLLGNALLKDKEQIKHQLKAGSTRPKIDISGIEFYKSIDNHISLTKDVITNYNTKLIQQQRVRNSFYDYDIYETKYNIRASIARRNGNDTQHNWSETILSVGGMSEVNTTTFGFTFVYLANKLSTNNLPKTDMRSYHGVVYIYHTMKNIHFVSSGIYGVTNYKNKNITGKYANEFSLSFATSYRFIVENVSINLGIDSKFMGINLSSHSYKDTFNKVINKEKLFVSLGYFIEVTTFKRLYHMFNDIGKVSVALHNSYTYVAGITNNDNIIVVDANNNPKSVPQDKFNNHRFYSILKTQLDYNNWFYNLSIDYHYRKDQNIYGANLSIGYKF